MAAETGLSYFHKTAFSSNKSILKTIKNQTLPRIGMTNTFNKASMFDIKNSVVQMTPEHNDLELIHLMQFLIKLVKDMLL